MGDASQYRVLRWKLCPRLTRFARRSHAVSTLCDEPRGIHGFDGVGFSRGPVCRYQDGAADAVGPPGGAHLRRSHRLRRRDWVRGKQTFFISGQRHEGRAELASLSAAIDATRFRTRRSTHALTADPGVEPQRQMVAA